jgi:DNA ligase-1
MIRKGAIKKIIGNNKQLVEHTIFVAHDELIDEPKRLEIVFDDAITRGLEGIIAKKLDGIYQPGARGWNWIKFKRSYSSKIDDTIDCVVMGYDYGKGKRHAFGIGAFMVGIYDKENDQYKTLAKIGTGLTDEEWKTLKKEGEKLKTEKKPISFDVDKLMECDVWTNPQIVVEIKADEITRSPVHTAGRVLKATKTGSALEVDTAGYALRFPRLVAFRNDKTPDDATSLHEIEELYSMQFKKVK